MGAWACAEHKGNFKCYGYSGAKLNFCGAGNHQTSKKVYWAPGALSAGKLKHPSRVEVSRRSSDLQEGKMDNEVFQALRDINPGNKPDIKPDVGGTVNLSEDLPGKDDVCLAPSTLETEPVKRKKRNKRGRPRMTKAAKKAAAKAKKSAKPLASKKDSAVKSAPVMSQMSPAVAKRVDEFKPREGTLRKRLLIALCSAFNKSVREVDLQTTLYGEINDASKSALAMNLKGVAGMIAKEKLPYALERVKNGDGETAIKLSTAK